MPEAPRVEIAGTRFTDVRLFQTIDSTNRYLLERAAAGEVEGVVAVADVQTAGRGRLGRSWEAPPGAALLVSVLLRPRVAREGVHLVTLATGMAAIDALRGITTLEPQLKWPNDVVVGDRKLAGILAEVDGDAVVVGMGCNLRGDWFPPELRDTAIACGADRDELLRAWLGALDQRLDHLDCVLDDARDVSATIGRRVRVDLPNGSFEGTARGFTPEGFLVVDDHVVTAGDVIHLRNM